MKTASAIDRHPTHAHSNFPAPLAFDRTGKLHQAIVASDLVGLQEVRSLYYITKEPGGDWARATVDSTAGHGPSGPTIGLRMSANISLCLTPIGSPEILANSSRSSADHLVVYFTESGVWKNREIDLRPVATYFGLASVETGGLKQILFDTYLEDRKSKTRGHIAIFSGQGDPHGVFYLALDDQWSVMDQRFLPALEFFGMAINEYETVYIALR